MVSNTYFWIGFLVSAHEKDNFLQLMSVDKHCAHKRAATR